MNMAKWSLSKYARWEGDYWKLIDSEPNKILALIIQELQLIVINGDVVLESINLAQMNKTIKSVYKNGTLVLALKYEGISFKFRVLFTTLSDGQECATILKNYIEMKDSGDIKAPEETLSEMLANALNNAESFPAPESIPENYPLEDAIKLCILDPGFPKFVGRVEKIINDFSKK